MEDYAIIKIRGNQYKVKKGDEILVPGTCDEKVDVDVLLKVTGGKVSLGKPMIKKNDVKLKLIKDGVKGKKIDVLKYRAKSRYRKKIGFRSISTKLQVMKI